MKLERSELEVPYHLPNHDEFWSELSMNGKHVENSEEESHEVESEDDSGREETISADGDWDES